MPAERANSVSQAIVRVSYLVGPPLGDFLLELLSLLPLPMAVAACFLLGTLLGVLLNARRIRYGGTQAENKPTHPMDDGKFASDPCGCRPPSSCSESNKSEVLILPVQRL